MLPKAAFQFGVKAGDGRKSGKDLTRKQDNKLSGQLRKIQARGPGDPWSGDLAYALPCKGLLLICEHAAAREPGSHFCMLKAACSTYVVPIT